MRTGTTRLGGVQAGRFFAVVCVLALGLFVSGCGAAPGGLGEGATSTPTRGVASGETVVAADAAASASDTSAEASTNAPSESAAASSVVTETEGAMASQSISTETVSVDVQSGQTVTNSTESSGAGASVQSSPAGTGGEASSPPGAATGTDASGEVSVETVPVSSDLTTFTDSEYGFAVDIPSNFAAVATAPDDLVGFDPMPVWGYRFMPATTAERADADLEIADLVVHIFPLAPSTSLEEWLAANRQLEGAEISPATFSDPATQGLLVCSAMPMGRACFTYTTGNGWVFRLTANTVEGEASQSTFRITH